MRTQDPWHRKFKVSSTFVYQNFIATSHYKLQNVLLVLKTVANKTVPFHSLVVLFPVTF